MYQAGTVSYVNIVISKFVIRLMKYWDFHESTMCWISAIVHVSSGHGAGTASYVNVDISTFVIRLMKYWEFHESMSQSANPPTSQIGIRCSRAKKVLWRCSEGALWDVVICRRLGDVLFCGTVVFGNTEQPRHWTTETTPGRIQAQWRTLLEMCELLFMTFYLPRNWRSLRNCL